MAKNEDATSRSKRINKGAGVYNENSGKGSSSTTSIGGAAITGPLTSKNIEELKEILSMLKSVKPGNLDQIHQLMLSEAVPVLETQLAETTKTQTNLKSALIKGRSILTQIGSSLAGAAIFEQIIDTV